MEKSRVFSKRKRKKKQAQRRKKEFHSVKKRKKLRCDSDWYWRSSTLTSRFWTKKSPSNQSLPCYIMLKTRFPFPYASTGLDTKTLTIASNRNSESRRSIRCLAPQHIFRFFHFCHGFPLSLATWLIFVSSSSTLHWAIEFKKKDVSAMGYFSREILIYRHWRQQVPLSHWFAV